MTNRYNKSITNYTHTHTRTQNKNHSNNIDINYFEITSQLFY